MRYVPCIEFEDHKRIVSGPIYNMLAAACGLVFLWDPDGAQHCGPMEPNQGRFELRREV